MRNTEQRVRFLYRGSFSNGKVFDDCNGKPYEIVLGHHQVLKALEDALSEMEPGAERVIELSPNQAYGEYDEDALQHVPTHNIPDGKNLPVGEMIGWTSPRNAKPIPVKVVKVENQIATLDFNHPLAGKDIVYWIKLVDIIV